MVVQAQTEFNSPNVLLLPDIPAALLPDLPVAVAVYSILIVLVGLLLVFGFLLVCGDFVTAYWTVHRSFTSSLLRPLNLQTDAVGRQDLHFATDGPVV